MKIINSIFITTSIILFSPASFAGDNGKHEAGKKLFNKNCAVCHGVAAGGMDMAKRVAPPIAAVRMHYLEAYPDEISFVKAVSDWVAKQESNRSLMPGAIQRFKIMPPLAISAEDAKKIATFIYSGDIEKPEGFEEHVKQEHAKKGMGQRQGKGMHQQGISMQQMEQRHNMPAKQQRMAMMMQNMQKKGFKGKKHRGGKHGSMSAKMMQRLNLSPQQQQQMQALIQEKERKIQPIKNQIRQISKTIRELDTSNPNYKAQIFSLADEKAKRVYRMVIEKGEMRMKIESVLTPQQRAKFKQLKEQRMNKRLKQQGK